MEQLQLNLVAASAAEALARRRALKSARNRRYYQKRNQRRALAADGADRAPAVLPASAGSVFADIASWREVATAALTKPVIVWGIVEALRCDRLLRRLSLHDRIQCLAIGSGHSAKLIARVLALLGKADDRAQQGSRDEGRAAI